MLRVPTSLDYLHFALAHFPEEELGLSKQKGAWNGSERSPIGRAGCSRKSWEFRKPLSKIMQVMSWKVSNQWQMVFLINIASHWGNLSMGWKNYYFNGAIINMAECSKIRQKGSMILEIVNGLTKEDQRLKIENGSLCQLVELAPHWGKVFLSVARQQKIYDSFPHWGNFSVAKKIIIRSLLLRFSEPRRGVSPDLPRNCWIGPRWGVSPDPPRNCWIRPHVG